MSINDQASKSELSQESFLFVITYGRSGSTVLMNLLNRIDGYCIRGENHGIVNELAKACRILKKAQVDFAKDSAAPSMPWYGIADVDISGFEASLTEAFCRSVLTPPPGTRVAGFKEVRYSPRDVSEEEYDIMIQFLAEHFGNSRFIFNTRDWAEVANSGWWRNYWSKYTVKSIIEESNERFRRSIDRLGDRAFLIDYSQYKNNPHGFDGLLAWLGETLPASVIEEVVREKLMHAVKVFRPKGTKAKIRHFVRKFL